MSFFKRIRKILQRLVLISVPAVMLTIVLIEIGLRLFVNVSDYTLVEYDTTYNLLRYKPDQQGTTVRPDFSAQFRINGAGWNSAVEYTPTRTPGTPRIAVIGDSYVEALQVDYDQNVAAVIAESVEAEVYSFGMSGAPLAQYLHMMRHVAEVYAPDVYVINMVHNDFGQSYRCIHARPYMLQFALAQDGQIIELPLEAYESSQARRLVVQSALVRYVAFNLDLLNRWQAAMGEENEAPQTHNLGRAEFEQHLHVWLDPLLPYVFGQFQEIAAQTQSRVLLVIDAPLNSIYAAEPLNDSVLYAYNVIVAQYAEQVGLPLVDLTDTFATDYAQHGQPLDFEHDHHWNIHAHRLAGEAIRARLAEWDY